MTDHFKRIALGIGLLVIIVALAIAERRRAARQAAAAYNVGQVDGVRRFIDAYEGIQPPDRGA